MYKCILIANILTTCTIVWGQQLHCPNFLYRPELNKGDHCLTRQPYDDFDNNKPIDMTVVAAVQNVGYFDKEEIFKTTLVFQFAWKDGRLKWKPKNNAKITNKTITYYPRSKIWVPDLAVYNAVDIEFVDDFRTLGTDTVGLTTDGNVDWLVFARINVACRLRNIHDFPFDKNKCVVLIGSLYTEVRFTQLLLLTKKLPVLQNMTQSMDWKLLNGSIYNGSDGSIVIEFDLERKYFYYYFLIIIPYELLSVLAAVAYLPQDFGDKASVTVAMLLSMTIYLLISSESTPKSMGEMHLLGKFLLYQMGLVITFSFISMYDITFLQNQEVQPQEAGDGVQIRSLEWKTLDWIIKWKGYILCALYYICLVINWVVHLT